MFIGRAVAEAESPILWPPDVKDWLIGKDPEAGKDWRQEEKGMTKDEMVGWRHQLSGHEFEQAPGVGYGQGRLVCCSPLGHKQSDITEWLNWTLTPPCYLTISQSENCTWCGMPLLTWPLKMPSWNMWHTWTFSALTVLDLLDVCHLIVNTALSFTTT